MCHNDTFCGYNAIFELYLRHSERLLVEKRTPHYNLDRLKGLLQVESSRMITARSFREAAELGYCTVDSMVEEVLSLSIRNHFDKSMTAHGQSKIWQDVYKKSISNGHEDIILYIKLQEHPIGQGVIISFHRSTEQ